MTEHRGAWHDDPILTANNDSLGRAHVARRTAKLIVDTHAWDSSVVFGLTGPWGSGKSSLIEMICESLGKQDQRWSVARFTPWATSSTETLLAEFYSALSASLPKSRGKQARRALASCAEVAGPALKLIPGAGAALSDAATLAGEALAFRPPWNVAFAKCAAEFTKINRPVLVVADDIDRLQHDELVSLLKVVRLLGRFPGVSYLLAYDEETLFANLEQAELGASSSERARLFMEKIVQYPIAVPPLLPSQMLLRLDTGLSAFLARLGRSISSEDSRLSLLSDVFERQLTTPRAIDRFLAQAELFVSMHDAREIDDIDLILLTLIRVQFPSLYGRLPAWRRALTASPSLWQIAKQEEKEPKWDKLLRSVNEVDGRRDAREVLAVLFPVMSKYSASRSQACAVSNASYFGRYFVHTIPDGDIADAEIAAALVEARATGAASQQIRGLLLSTHPDRADLALSKLWNASVPGRDQTQDPPPPNPPMLAAVMAQLLSLKSGANSMFRRRERAIHWAAELTRLLPPSTTAEELRETLASCTDLSLQLRVLWRTTPNPNDQYGDRGPEPIPAITETSRRLSKDALALMIRHLRARDRAETELSILFLASFIARFGAVDEARQEVLEGLGKEFTTEDLAARFVGVVLSIGPKPIPSIDSFDQESFAMFAPSNDPLYNEELVEVIEDHDVSWVNLRKYVRGRARSPETAEKL